MPEEKKEIREDKPLAEQLWDSTKEFFVRVKEDADKSIKIISLKNEVSRLKREQNNLYSKLGEIVYQKISLGSLKDSELKPIAEDIKKVEQEIDEKERQIEKIKSAISSPAPEKPPAVKKQKKTTKAKTSKSKKKKQSKSK